MAFVANQTNKDDETQGGPVQTSSGGASLGAQGGGTGTGATVAPQEAPHENNTGSGTFTNLNAYLTDNSYGARNLANTINTGLGKDINAANTGINNAVGSFGKDVAAGTDTFNQGLVDKATSDPTSFANNSDYMTQLAKMKAGAYTGPTAFEGSQYATNAQNLMGTANTNATMSGTQGGREQLLRQDNPKAPYTQGDLTLDSFILGGTPGAAKSVGDQANQANLLPGNFLKGQGQADYGVKLAQNTSSNTGIQTTGALETAQNNYRSQIDQAVNAAQNNQNQQFQGLSSALQPSGPSATYNVSDAQLSQMGVSRDQWNQLIALNNKAIAQGGAGVNLGQYLTNTPGSFSEASVASPDQIAYWNAINQLAGTSNQLTGGAGSAGGSAYDYNGALQALQNDIVASAPKPVAQPTGPGAAPGTAPGGLPPGNTGGAPGTTIPVPGSAGGLGGYAGGGSVGIGPTAAAAGAGLTSILGLAGQLGKAANTAAADGAGAASGLGLSTILGGVGAGLSLYNFGKNWQSGGYVNNSINGAEAGAAVGTLVMPGIGTLVGAGVGALAGAASSLFGPGKTDPETTVWNNYLTQDQKTKGLGLAVDNPYIPLAGMFDEGASSVPIYQKFGRMGEQKFTNSLMSTISGAMKNGKISSSTSPEEVYNNVVVPWVSSMGNWSKVGPEYKQALGELLVNMTGQYMSGTYAQNWKAIGGDTPFASSPSYKAGSAASNGGGLAAPARKRVGVVSTGFR